MGVLTGGLLAAPLMAEAQQAQVYRIGVVLLLAETWGLGRDCPRI